MSMYSTKISLGRASGVGAKLMMLFTPARTSVSGRVLRGLARHREHGDLDAQVAHQRLHERGVDAAHPVDLRVGERGVDVERRHDRHGRTLVGEVGEHGVPQVADADQRDLLPQRSVEEVPMLSMQAATS